jgi:hypothetical protein
VPWIFRGVSKPRWNQQKHVEEYDWLSAGEIPAETLVDVVREDVQSNELSVYILEDEEASLRRMVAAFAVNRQRPDNVDYKLVDYEKLVQIGFEFKETSGITSDVVVNTWHRDLNHLTTNKLMKFIEILYFEAETRRVLKKDVEKWITESIQHEYIDKNLIREESMLRKIEELQQKYS